MKIGLCSCKNINKIKDFIENISPDFWEKHILVTKPDFIDILILNEETENINSWIEKTDQHGYIILNSDIKVTSKNIKIGKRKLITTGLNSKSCVTTSSILEDHDRKIQVCVQREIININNKKVYEQEFSIYMKNLTPQNLLILVTLFLILDIEF